MFCPSIALPHLALVHRGKVTWSVLYMTLSSERNALYIEHLFNIAAIQESVKPSAHGFLIPSPRTFQIPCFCCSWNTIEFKCPSQDNVFPFRWKGYIFNRVEFFPFVCWRSMTFNIPSISLCYTFLKKGAFFFPPTFTIIFWNPYMAIIRCQYTMFTDLQHYLLQLHGCTVHQQYQTLYIPTNAHQL